MPKNEKPAAAAKLTLKRSPNYPAIDLGTALKLAKKLYDAANRNPISVSVAATTWGYGEKSSGGKQAMGALRKFGLLEDVGGGRSGTVRISDLAHRLVVYTSPEHAAERAELLRKAALAPALYREIIARYPAALPTDAILTAHLEVDRGFNGNVVADVIGVFRRTLAAAGLDKGGTIELPPSATASAEDNDEEIPMPAAPPTSAAPTVSGGSVVVTPPPATVAFDTSGPRVVKNITINLAIGRGKWAALTAPESMTSAEWDNLQTSIKAAKVGFIVEG